MFRKWIVVIFTPSSSTHAHPFPTGTSQWVPLLFHCLPFVCGLMSLIKADCLSVLWGYWVAILLKKSPFFPTTSQHLIANSPSRRGGASWVPPSSTIQCWETQLCAALREVSTTMLSLWGQQPAPLCPEDFVLLHIFPSLVLAFFFPFFCEVP